MTQPNQSTMPPTRPCSQVTSEQIKQQSKSWSQELRRSARASQEPINHSPVETANNQNQFESGIGPPSSAKKKLQLGDSKAQPEQVSQSHDCPGSCVMNKVKIKPEEEWNVLDRRQSPCKHKAPPPSPAPKTEHSRSCPRQDTKKHFS